MSFFSLLLKAATKFLRCVTWSDVSESSQALELLNEWGPIPTADALELLSSSFPYEGVRAYAVKQLHKADQEELGNYLLQLVQALRYEQTVPNNLSESAKPTICTVFIVIYSRCGICCRPSIHLFSSLLCLRFLLVSLSLAPVSR